jgi:anti-sigma factor RsiW
MSKIDRDELMAYADGILDGEERSRIEKYLADHPDAAADVTQIERENAAIRALYEPVSSEPVPERLSVTRHARRQREANRRIGLTSIAAMLVLALGIGAGWVLRAELTRTPISDRLIADAVSAHTVYALEQRHAVEVPGSDSAHLTTWLSTRLQTQLAVPNLSNAGLTFLGGRLLPAPDVAGGRAAQMMYEDSLGARLTLYITPSPGPDTPTFELANLGLDTALFWSDEAIACTITAPYPAEKLQAIAHTVFSQLQPNERYEYEG